MKGVHPRVPDSPTCASQSQLGKAEFFKRGFPENNQRKKTHFEAYMDKKKYTAASP